MPTLKSETPNYSGILVRRLKAASWSTIWFTVVFLVLVFQVLIASAQQVAKPSPEQTPPPVSHPHINLATWFEIDPAWPQKPADIQWADVPGVAVDRNDNVWMFTRAKPHVQVYDSAGKFVRAWNEDLIQTSHGLRIDPEGNIWVTDVGAHVVMQLTPEGKLLKTLGTSGVPGEDATHFNKPTDVAFSPSGDVFVADGYGNNRIVHFDRNGNYIKAWGKLGVGRGEFSLPHAIVRDSQGHLYVADRNNVRVQVFDENGTFLEEWRNLLVPWGLSITKNDEILACGSTPMTWLADQKFLGCPPKDQVVMRLSTSGKILSLWTIPKGEDGKEKPGEINWIHGIAADSQGNVFVGDIKGKRLYKLVSHQDPAASSP